MPQVRDLMVSDVVTIEPGTSVVNAAKRMIQEKKGPLPIVESDRPVAIITDQDIDDVRRLMDQHQLDRILVVEGDRLVGIISEADIRADEGPLA